MPAVEPRTFKVHQIGPEHLGNPVIRAKVIGTRNTFRFSIYYRRVNNLQRPFGLTKVIGITGNIVSVKKNLVAAGAPYLVSLRKLGKSIITVVFGYYH